MNITFNNKKIILIIFGISLLVDLLVLFNFNLFPIRTVIVSIYLLFIPGLLITLSLKIKKLSIWEYLVYIMGLSIGFLIIGGLILNWSLPLVSIKNPLSSIYILALINLFNFIFSLICYFRKSSFYLNIDFTKISFSRTVLVLFPLIFPLMSIFGATLINNNGENFLSLINIALIAIYITFIFLYKNKFEKFYPYIIFILSLSLLLMSSYRGWHIMGSDILSEFKVFKLTSNNAFWDFNLYRNAYNACLSITILPKIFSSLLGISDENIFKVYIQIIFSFVPVTIFLFTKKYIPPFYAFGGVLLYISSPIFNGSMPMHIRQEFALLFFALLVYVLFNNKINTHSRTILSYFFAICMILSHYSTTYVALIVFIITYILSTFIYITYRKLGWIYEKFNMKFKNRSDYGIRNINLSLIVTMLFFTFLWYSILNPEANNFVSYSKVTVRNILNVFNDNTRMGQTSLVDQFNIFYQSKNNLLLLQEFLDSKDLIKNSINDDFYPYSTYKDYNPILISSSNVPSHFSLPVIQSVNLITQLVEKLIKLSLLIGIVYLVFVKFKKRNDKDIITLCIGGLSLLFLFMTIPRISIDYELLRVYAQLQTFLIYPTILGMLFWLKRIKLVIRDILFMFIVITYLLNNSGFIPQVLGNSQPLIQFNNFGINYDRFMPYDTDIRSAKWLEKNRSKYGLIYADISASEKIKYATDTIIFTKSVIYPSIIERSAYVYLSRANIKKNSVYTKVNGQDIAYTLPRIFLQNNKNKLYNNGSSEIYR